MIKKVLIANRGEIAIRIARTCKRMGIATVGVFSDADKEALFLNFVDEKLRIGPPPPRESYLQIEHLLDAAEQSKADAIHPGYGFLSENADLAMRAQTQGLTWIGPPADAVKKMGSKIGSRKIAESLGVPTVPGNSEAVYGIDSAKAIAGSIGYPVMVKASAGGGGIGMAKADDETQLARVFEDAGKKAASFFGDPTVFIEKAIVRPRHIEVQVFGDKLGTVIHLGERECSIQRRNQKVVEETPSPFVTPELREKMTAAALTLAKAVNYFSSGTVEFIVDQTGNFFFLEMNTRLQVEHTVTEMVTGLDLVEWQIRVANGEALPTTTPKFNGHSIQFRLCAEDPDKRFVPQPGTITDCELPTGEGIRTDMAIGKGSVITPYYDSMFGKLVVWGADRPKAIERAKEALEKTRITGIKTNLDLHRRVVDSRAFAEGRLSTAFLSEELGYKW